MRVVESEGEEVFLCGDDNEVLSYSGDGQEERESALKERHTINVRSRSRIIGMCFQSSKSQQVLYVLGQEGDLDAIVAPTQYLLNRRCRRLCLVSEENEKRPSVGQPMFFVCSKSRLRL